MRTILALALFALATPALAVTYTETLTGKLADRTTSSGVIGGKLYTFTNLELTGFTPITVNNGDRVIETVTFDGTYTVDASPFAGSTQFFGITQNSDNPNPNSFGTIDFIGLTGLAINPVGANCLCIGAIFTQSEGAAYSFTGFTSDVIVSNLATGLLVTGAHLFTQVNPGTIPTPEPSAMILFGCAVGLAGLAAGNRRRV